MDRSTTARRKSLWLALALLPWLANGASQDLYLECLTNFERYSETLWHPAAYTGAPPDAGYWGDGATTGNGGIRGNAGVAMAYAVLLQAQPASPSNATRLNHLRQALNYTAGTHTSGAYSAVDGKKWGWNTGSAGTCGSSGTDWQTSLWASPTAFACFLAQSNLPPATVTSVQAMLISEANHRAGVAPCSGWIGDTKAEENGWDDNVVACAAAWLPTNANAAAWLSSAQAYLANTYTMSSTAGDPLATYVMTATAYPSWGIENHGFFHPEYAMVAGEEMGDSWLMAHWMNTNVAAQLAPFAAHNVLAEWASLSHSAYGWGELAYPDGEDWALHSFGENSYLAYLAAHLNDPVARYADNNLAQLERYRQVVNGNGQFVGPSGGGFYREAVQAYRTAMAWMQWQVADYPTGVITPPPPAFGWLPDVAVITHRTANYFCSISYGPQTNGSSPHIMAIIDPASASVPTNTYLTTPRQPGIIGLGAMGYPTAGALINLSSNANGFTAELRLTNGTAGTTEVYVNSTGETVGIVEVPQPFAGATGAAGSFTMGIQNDPLSGGARLLEWTGSSIPITNLSGAVVNVTNHWICVAGRHAVLAGPAGYFNYQAAGGYTRVNQIGGVSEAGVAEDTLQFMITNATAPRYAVWFPGTSAAQMAAKAAQVVWTVSSTNATLSFPGPNGVTAQIVAAVPVQPVYPPYSLAVSNLTSSSYQTGSSSYPPSLAVDGNLSTFWVSSGVSAGQGPTPAHPEWLAVAFPRLVAISEVLVYPRYKYGPANVAIQFNGTTAYSGIMANSASPLDVKFSPPTYATNAELYITGSYDPSYPTTPRNVQVEELIFYERARPGTYADWELQTFSSAQMTNPFYEGPLADPDGDGVPNLVEFAVGGDPLVPDASLARIQLSSVTNGLVALEYRQRKDLGDVTTVIQHSRNLLDWSALAPASVTNTADLGAAWLIQARFPMPVTTGYYRIQYHWPGL